MTRPGTPASGPAGGAATGATTAPVIDAAGLQELDDVLRVEELLEERGHASIGNLWGSAQALVLAALALRPRQLGRAVLVVTSSENESAAFADDCLAFGLAARQFPARESRGKRGAAGDVEAVRSRLQITQALAGPEADRPRVLVASMLALLQPVPTLKDLENKFLELRVGDVLDAERLLTRLVQAGYARQPLAEAPGEVSLRGDILDLFPFSADVPLRIELFEDEIESLRTFDPADQRSIEQIRELQVCLAGDAGGIRDGQGTQIIQLLSAGALVFHVEPLRVGEKVESLRIRSPDHERALRIFDKGRLRHRAVALQSLPGDDLSMDTRSIQGLQVGMRQARGALEKVVDAGATPVVLCLNRAEEHRLREALDNPPWLDTRIGAVTKGFRVPAWGLVVVNHHELKGVLGARRRARPMHAHKVKAIQSFFELKAGDLVVCFVHGLARFRGLVRMQRGGGEEDHLHLLFADEVSLYVPSSRVDMVQRYIGPGASGLPLDRIGSSAFRRRKERVERGLFDMAAELIEVQAHRSLRKRPTWRGDDELVSDLVQSFPYEDTADQVTVDAEIQTDLYGERPMDRMICGDVGFGKTELALRAAFRVVNGGGQVAILVPTTILAQQHHVTFSERLADYPGEVAVLSRYVTGKAARAVIERTAAGLVDILIGTHRILSKDVSFQHLGLVIIDEEQRFGVTHKEHFKRLRAEVDVLTLTATPIPRTLHMSLSGIRDISALTIPPPGRQEIETCVAYGDDEDLLRDAMLRELDRGGQVFFLHNRVASIDAIADRVQALLPDASLAIGHGQMAAHELRHVMEAFTRGDVDVLVATTIIENGLDIPLAGTILIDDADHFGLAELHQLRGRVGRGSQKAFCYLLVERHKPLRTI
ncbi:MAG: DEAD/DEAH box helicase, partial [Planctomycetota bacterium]